MKVTEKKSSTGRVQWFIEQAKMPADKAIDAIHKNKLKKSGQIKSGQYLITEWK